MSVVCHKIALLRLGGMPLRKAWHPLVQVARFLCAHLFVRMSFVHSGGVLYL
jgi:hypothetical protein